MRRHLLDRENIFLWCEDSEDSFHSVEQVLRISDYIPYQSEGTTRSPTLLWNTGLSSSFLEHVVEFSAKVGWLWPRYDMNESDSRP